MASDLLSIGTTGVMAFKRSLATIGHNISNANTESYSRQRVDLVSRQGAATGSGFSGAGVEASNTRRLYEEYAELQVQSRNSSVEYFSVYRDLSSQIDNLMADPDAGINPALSDFFDAVQSLADDPSSLPARTMLLSEGETLTERFRGMNKWMDDLRRSTNNRLDNIVVDINGFASSIADLNRDIKTAFGSTGNAPNDLLDQRNDLIQQLAKRVDVTTLPQNDGSLNVFIGKGQSLVVGPVAMAFQTRLTADDPVNKEVAFVDFNKMGNVFSITDSLTGGEIGGVLAFRNEVLNVTQNNLGRLAISTATTFNAVHRQGMDLNNDLGGDFFQEPLPEVVTSTSNTGTATFAATITDVNQLTAADYRLTVLSPTSFRLLNRETSQISTLNTPADGPPFLFDGLQIDLTAGVAAVGDVFSIYPTRGGARDINPLLANSAKIAAASPLRAEKSINNLGKAELRQVTVSDITNAAFTTTNRALTPPIRIEFDNPAAATPMSYSLYNNTSNALLEANIAYDPATGADVFPSASGLDFGYRTRIEGIPQAGDIFTIDYNTDGVGDNRNALDLVNIQEQAVLNGGTSTLQDAYGELVVNVGHKTRQAEINANAQSALLFQASQFRGSISGVNLDEEAADLLRYQQAYTAAAQIITASERMFQTLMSVVGG